MDINNSLHFLYWILTTKDYALFNAIINYINSLSQ